jgi:predicted ATPase
MARGHAFVMGDGRLEALVGWRASVRPTVTNRIDKIHLRNFRSLADVEIELGSINVLFGRNGAGKSSFLDAVWFARDCGVRGVEMASSSRSHGIGLLFDGADEGALLELALESGGARYELRFGLSAGRVEPFAGERLRLAEQNRTLIDRTVGSDKARFWHAGFDEMTVTLREPQKLSLARYADLDGAPEAAAEMDRALRFIHKYDSRHFWLNQIKGQGSEAGTETFLWDNGKNLWSVLRNLRDRSRRDERLARILRYMREAFPASFDDLDFEPTAPTTVYGSFLEKGRRQPILASGVSDGHLQMLLLLTALFAEGETRGSLLLFDEPEISLHPWALAVLANAMREAATSWEKQIVLATHSPALLSQFEPSEILVSEMVDGQTVMRRLSEVEEVRDLLEEFSVGSLYMSEVVAPQSDGGSKDPAHSGAPNAS